MVCCQSPIQMVRSRRHSAASFATPQSPATVARRRSERLLLTVPSTCAGGPQLGLRLPIAIHNWSYLTRVLSVFVFRGRTTALMVLWFPCTQMLHIIYLKPIVNLIMSVELWLIVIRSMEVITNCSKLACATWLKCRFMNLALTLICYQNKYARVLD